MKRFIWNHNFEMETIHIKLLKSLTFRGSWKFYSSQPPGDSLAHSTRMIFFICLCNFTVYSQ